MRYWRKRGIKQSLMEDSYYRSEYLFDSNCIIISHNLWLAVYFQKQKRKICNDTTFCNFSSMLLDNCTVNNSAILICKGVYYVSQYSRNI